MSDRKFAERSISRKTPDGMFKATAELHSLSGQAPYLSMTGELRSIIGERDGGYICGRVNSCGCMHEDVLAYIPEFAPFVRWHLVSTDQPMHYKANAMYWAGFNSEWCKGEANDPPNLAHVKSTIIYGALEDDQEFDLDGVVAYTRQWIKCPSTSSRQGRLIDVGNDVRGTFERWLDARKPRLMEKFKSDMFTLFADNHAGVRHAFEFDEKVRAAA